MSQQGLLASPTVGQTCSNTVAHNLVVSTVPQAGALVSANTTVKLIVSSGYCQVVVPSVINDTVAQASQALSQAGLCLLYTSRLALEFIEPDSRSGERVEIEDGVTIGRSRDCDLVLYDTYLSTRHAHLSNDEGDLSIEDLGSTNGTYVNQELVKGRVHLERGDVVQVGGVLFEVVR